MVLFKLLNAKKTLILGLGNTLLSDDGVGIYVAREIRRILRSPDVEVAEASAGGLELLDMMWGFDRAAIVDAVVTGRRPAGSLSVIGPDDLPGGSSMARHRVGLKEALELGRRLKMDLPAEVVVYGIEVADPLTFGEACTPSVAARIPALACEIAERERGAGEKR